MFLEYPARVPERKKSEATFPCKFRGLWPGFGVAAKTSAGPVAGLLTPLGG